MARYKIILERLAPDANQNQAVGRISRLLGVEPRQVTQWLQGPRIVVKRNLDENTANRLQQTLGQVGAEISIEEHAPPPVRSTPAAEEFAPARGNRRFTHQQKLDAQASLERGESQEGVLRRLRREGVSEKEAQAFLRTAVGKQQSERAVSGVFEIIGGAVGIVLGSLVTLFFFPSLISEESLQLLTDMGFSTYPFETVPIVLLLVGPIILAVSLVFTARGLANTGLVFFRSMAN